MNNNKNNKAEKNSKQDAVKEKFEREKTNFSLKNIFARKVCAFLDFIPSLKKEESTLFRKLLHTTVGFACYVILLMVPMASYYATNTCRKFDLVFVLQGFSVCALARNALTVYLVVGEVIENLILPSKARLDLKPKELQIYHRGLRNFLILVALFIARTYQLFWFDLPSKNYYFMGRPNNIYDKYGFLALFYLQVFLVSVMTIWVDDYLEIFSIIKTNKLVLYQVGELLISLLYADPVINYSYYHVFFGTAFVLIVKILMDNICRTTFTIQHNAVRGYTKVHTIKASAILLSATFMHSLVKRGLYSFITMMLNPFLNKFVNPFNLKYLVYLERYIAVRPSIKDFLTQLEVPEYIHDSYLLNDQSLSVNILPYMPTWNCYTFWQIMLCAIIEYGVIKPFFIYTVTAYTADLRPSTISEKIKASNCRLKNVMPNESAINAHLSKKINILILKSIFLSFITDPLIAFIPIYGFVIKGTEIAHLYNLTTSITASLKTFSEAEIASLPSVIRGVVKNL